MAVKQVSNYSIFVIYCTRLLLRSHYSDVCTLYYIYVLYVLYNVLVQYVPVKPMRPVHVLFALIFPHSPSLKDFRALVIC